MSVHTEFPTTSTQLAVQNEKRTKQLEAKAGSKTECRAADLWALFCRNGCRWRHNWQQEGETQLARSASEDLTKIKSMKTPSIFAVSSWWSKFEANANPPQSCQLWNPHHEVKHQRHQRCFWSIPCTGHWRIAPSGADHFSTSRGTIRNARHLSKGLLRSDGGESDRPAFMVNHPFSEKKTCQMVIFLGQNPEKKKTFSDTKKNCGKRQKPQIVSAWVCYPSTSIVYYPTSWNWKNDMLGLSVLNFHMGPEVCSNKRRSHWKPRQFSPMDSPRSAFAIEICAFCGAGQNLS